MTADTKICSRCAIEKSADDFYRIKAKNNALSPHCKACQSKASMACQAVRRKAKSAALKLKRESDPYFGRRAKKQYDANPEKFRARSKANREKFKDYYTAYSKEYRAKNADKISSYLQGYYQENSSLMKARANARAKEKRIELRPAYNAQAMKRYAKKRSATPAWANQAEILKIYKECAKVSALTGIKHNVDHMVPILSKKVCGLHVEHNLQIILRLDNISKGNRFWPDQW